jgi:hypothetical protein
MKRITLQGFRWHKLVTGVPRHYLVFIGATHVEPSDADHKSTLESDNVLDSFRNFIRNATFAQERIQLMEPAYQVNPPNSLILVFADEFLFELLNIDESSCDEPSNSRRRHAIDSLQPFGEDIATSSFPKRSRYHCEILTIS